MFAWTNVQKYVKLVASRKYFQQSLVLSIKIWKFTKFFIRAVLDYLREKIKKNKLFNSSKSL